MSKVSTETSLQILALIARGDTLTSISQQTGIAITTIADLKKRNQSALSLIESRMIEHKISNATKLLDKSQSLIEKKLDRVASAADLRQEALEEYRTGAIDSDEFRAKTFGLPDATLTELNGIAKESFNQSQIEQGKPTSITNSPEAKEDLLALAQALKDGDEVEMYKLVFNSKLQAIEAEAI